VPRRRPYTRVEKSDEIRARHVRGMGDVAFRGFQCLNSECTQWIVVRDDAITDVYEIVCPSCGYEHRSGEEVTFYRYILRHLETDEVVEEGEFSILTDDYLAEAERYKYCIICNTLKPLSSFDQHGARNTQRQGECRLCKRVYNSIKNQTRTSDQHREAAQKRRMYLDLSGSPHIDSLAIFQRFGHRCFKCGRDLSGIDAAADLDHTLPALYLWPLTTESATLLCRSDNSEKAGKWPNAFYNDAQLRRLSALTGLDYGILTAPVPYFNPEALRRLQDPDAVDRLVEKYAPYMDELIRVRNRVLQATGLDFFRVARIVSPDWIRRADAALR
jgi:hypothetical protein